jgi:signal transduction histidine kinase
MGGAFEGFAWPVGQGFVGIIARECVSLAIDDAANDRRADNQYLRERQVASLLGTPLKIQQKMIGVIFVGTTEPHQFSTEEIRRFEVMAQRAATGVESIMMYTELRTTGEELAAKNRELESFVYTVSHDLKTPLVTLQGFVGSLVEDYGAQLDEVAHRYLDHIGEAAIRMEQLLSGLLNLSRIGRVIHPHTLVSFADVVNDALMAVAPRIEEHHIEMSLPSEWPHVFCDRQRMTEVMVNLLSNAVKFMGTQGSPRIEIGWEEQEENHCFYVKDNGVGIEPVYHQKIFEPFQRLGEVNGAEGTGLGLAIVKKIVEAHGGTVRVESQKRHGDTATRRHGDTATEADDSFAASPRPPVPASPEQGSTFYFTIPKRE